MVILDRTAAALCSSSCFFRAWTVHVTSHVHPIQSAPSSSFPDHVTIISEKKSSADGGDSDCDDNDDGNGDDDDDGNDDDAASLPAPRLSHNPMNSPPLQSHVSRALYSLSLRHHCGCSGGRRGGGGEGGGEQPPKFFPCPPVPNNVSREGGKGRSERERERP